MRIEEIKVFQVDDWAYVAAETPEQAAAHVESTYSRPEDPDDFELEEVAVSGKILTALEEHVAAGGHCPSLIGIDSHYA